eukprot:6185751-Pleurochrysis_carterae.AAC.1
MVRLGLFKDQATLHVVCSDSQDDMITYDDSNEHDDLLVDRNETEIIARLVCVWMTPEACGIMITSERLLVWEHEAPFFDQHHPNVQFVKRQHLE